MTKFGADSEAFTLVKTRFGARHAVKGPGGTFFHCNGNPALCKFCHEQGVPVSAPDPIEAMTDALRAHWGARWAESHRHPVELAENEIWQGRGVHIVALDDAGRDRTVLVSFGANDEATAAVSALVHVHNEMVGRPD